MISGGEEGATGDHEEMGQYAEEEAFQGEYVTDPEEGREYDIDEYGRYYLSGYYGDADEEEVKPPAQSPSGSFRCTRERRSDGRTVRRLVGAGIRPAVPCRCRL
ncbi:hypothetical protein DVH05_001166 [Phytophthora capsici]|nr:hypothetical protein DVH05_001166 [Phytophthora capsici]